MEFLPFTEELNGNGRRYTYECIDISAYENLINTGSALGELCHDKDPTDTISLANVSHKINSIHKNEKGIYGVIELLDTPRGHIAQMLIDGMLIVRPRMLGLIGTDGIPEITEIISFDLISGNNDSFNPDSYKNRRYKLKKS